SLFFFFFLFFLNKIKISSEITFLIPTLLSAGAKQTCPLEISPNPMVIEYKSRAQGATCSSVSTNSENVLRIHWEGVKTDNMTWWANTRKCNNSLNYTLYKKPDSVSIYRVNTWSSVEEGKEFQLRCDIVNVAPAQKLSVLWYRNQGEETFCKYDVRSPVNVSSTLKVTLQKHDNGAEFRCEAQLNLGLKSPPKITSSGLNFTISCKISFSYSLFSVEMDLLWIPCVFKVFILNVFKCSYDELIVSKPGIYTCNATNDAGHATHVLEVILTGNIFLICIHF
uniref:Ig-like domain-containing protein n=1 Tax=Amphilophus citrinellus TaxID=61819 RepID=A0A3Q0RMU8_AMPCI